ncbi:MAG: hypothetical protein RL138_338 [Bacteroidota bacterium]
MKYVLKLEALGLLGLFSGVYFHYYPATWGFFLALFFVPDLSFSLFVISKKAGAIAYNVFHHQGILIALLLIGYYLKNDTTIQIAFIFLAHSSFDRVFGYGLKYLDSFDHTHLGWVGKSKHLNTDN